MHIHKETPVSPPKILGTLFLYVGDFEKSAAVLAFVFQMHFTEI